MALEPIVRMQVTVNATAERAWSALTDGAALQGWYAEHASVDLASGRFDFWGQFTAGTPDRDGGRHCADPENYVWLSGWIVAVHVVLAYSATPSARS